MSLRESALAGTLPRADRALGSFASHPEGQDVRGEPMSFKVSRMERRLIEAAAARAQKSVAAYMRDYLLRGLTPEK